MYTAVWATENSKPIYRALNKLGNRRRSFLKDMKTTKNIHYIWWKPDFNNVFTLDTYFCMCLNIFYVSVYLNTEILSSIYICKSFNLPTKIFTWLLVYRAAVYECVVPMVWIWTEYEVVIRLMSDEEIIHLFSGWLDTFFGSNYRVL